MSALEELGLSSYEEKAYRALVSLGTATARDVSDASDVPRGRIYDVLNGLESRGIVSVRSGDPREYAAVEPDEAVDRLLRERRRELRRRDERYRTLAERVRSDLAPTPPTGGNFWAASLGSEDAVTLLREQARDAAERVLAVVGLPYERAPWEAYRREFDAFVESVGDDVDVDLLLSDTLVEGLPPAVTERFADPGIDLEVRRAADLHVTFEVVDGEAVCIDIPAPFDRAERLGVVEVTDEAFAATVERRFAPVWADARPID